jgi:hypothetical protein
VPKPAVVQVAKVESIPVPRQKPIEVIFAAAANMKIMPAAAAPESKNFAARTRPAADPIGSVEAAETIVADSVDELVVNSDAKGSFGGSTETTAPAKRKPAIRTVSASAGEGDLNWWPKSFGIESQGAAPREVVEEPSLPSGLFPSANAAEPDRNGDVETNGKSDMLEINRESKGDLLMDAPPRRRKLGQLFNW